MNLAGINGYHLSLSDEADKQVARILVAFIPWPGMLLIVGGEIWEVACQPQVLIPGDGSQGDRRQDPVLVDVRVRPGSGIHDD